MDRGKGDAMQYPHRRLLRGVEDVLFCWEGQG